MACFGIHSTFIQRCDFKDPLIHLLTDIKHRGRKEGHRKNEFSWKESEHDDGGGRAWI
jgi:hypothetical protein